MSDYTPTTGQVRHGYSISDGGLNDTWLREDAEGRFDRWLAEVKAQTWEEGYNAKWAETWFEDNPYRGKNK